MFHQYQTTPAGVITGSLLVALVLIALPALAQETDLPELAVEQARIAFVLTDDSIKQLRGNAVPDEVLAQLEPLQGTIFRTEGLFVRVLEEAIGAVAVAQYQDALLKAAYTYDGSDRREPFKALVGGAEQGEEAPAILLAGECPPPLGDYAIGQFQVIGILLGEPGDRARIKAPDGESYTIMTADCIGNRSGKVLAFSEDCVIIRETQRSEQDGDITETVSDVELCLSGRE